MVWSKAVPVLVSLMLCLVLATAAYSQDNPEPQQPADETQNPPADDSGTPAGQEPQPPTCPNAPGPIQCGEGQNMVEDKDGNGCVVGYHCDGSPGTPTTGQCPNVPGIQCGEGSHIVDDSDGKGCIVGRHCESNNPPSGTPTTGTGQMGGCPPAPAGIQCQYRIVDDFDQNGCIIGRRCVQDTAAGGQAQDYGRQCPLDQKCSDGTTPCSMTSDGRCECKPCPPPQGCTEEKDPATGFVKVICNGGQAQATCPMIPQGEEQRCEEKGGKPVNRHDARGCGFIDCQMSDMGDNPFSQQGNMVCPLQEEIDRTKEKCTEMGQRFVVINDRGCKVGVCRADGGQENNQCGMVAGPVREQIEKECKQKGMGTVSDFDEKGCQSIRCGNPNECMTKLPGEAYTKCQDQGGEMVVKTDGMGCIMFKQCVMKGDESQVYYEDVEKVPEVTDLLAIAFKLEELKLQFDKLQKKTEDIARYYESTGSGEAERFKRVSGMFGSIKDKIEEIKAKLKSKVETLTVDDIADVKHDIKYIKEKMLRDVVYIMLSSSDEIKSIISSEESDCGSDGTCFNDALKVCKAVSFSPEDGGSDVRITGMDGASCAITVSAKGQGGAAMAMECKYPNYAMGMNGPQDILPYCTGQLADYMKKHGTEQPAGPGGCKGKDECDKYCKTNQADCQKWCDQNPDLCGQKTQKQEHVYEKVPAPDNTKEEYSVKPVEHRQVETMMSEQVKCVFTGSTEAQNCRADDGAYCSGSGTCVSEVKGQKGQKLVWKSSCGGYATTMIDGQNDYAEFDCAQAGTTSGGPAPPTTATSGGGSTPCSGCLNNGVCDQGECAGCADCMNGG